MKERVDSPTRAFRDFMSLALREGFTVYKETPRKPFAHSTEPSPHTATTLSRTNYNILTDPADDGIGYVDVVERDAAAGMARCTT